MEGRKGMGGVAVGRVKGRGHDSTHIFYHPVGMTAAPVEFLSLVQRR